MNRQQAMELEKLMEQLKSLELEEAVDLQVKAMQEWIEKREALEKKTQGAEYRDWETDRKSVV